MELKDHTITAVSDTIEIVQQLRKELHQHPELSGQEKQTALRIKDFIQKHHPTEVITELGGTGLAAVYHFSEPGPTVMIRCELDALPIEESNTFSYRSATSGVAHKCGHDGHMSIVAGLIFWIKAQAFTAGKVILLFQPAEETGAGAFEVLNDPKFSALRPDYIFALHNLPGEPAHSIITVKKSFTATVQSVAIHLTGKQSHASEPENGINPAVAMATIINELSALNVPDVSNENFVLLTPVHMKMGSKSYGISAGSGELHYTMRAWTDGAMDNLKKKIAGIVESVARANGLQFALNWFDYFPATRNDSFCNEMIVRAAQQEGLVVRERSWPLKFGEDYGWFSKEHKVAMFGLGAGEKMPALHHADYDFPDEIAETGIRMFGRIIHQVLTGTIQ